jgi:hypothetical protein
MMTFDFPFRDLPAASANSPSGPLTAGAYSTDTEGYFLAMPRAPRTRRAGI